MFFPLWRNTKISYNVITRYTKRLSFLLLWHKLFHFAPKIFSHAHFLFHMLLLLPQFCR